MLHPCPARETPYSTVGGLIALDWVFSKGTLYRCVPADGVCTTTGAEVSVEETKARIASSKGPPYLTS